MVPVVVDGQGSDHAPQSNNSSIIALFSQSVRSAQSLPPCPPNYPRTVDPPASPSASAPSSRRRAAEGEAEGVPPIQRPRLAEAGREVAVRALSDLAHAMDEEANESIRRTIRK